MRILLIIVLLALMAKTYAFNVEIVTVKLNDGEELIGRLVLPEKPGNILELIIFVQSSGPHTYLDHRKIGNKEFNYFDVLAEPFTKNGIAFFSYNRRGVYPGSKPPYYDSIDSEKFKKYLPLTESDDLAVVINQLKKDKRFKKSKIVLLGWSEGTVVATLVAEQKKAKVDALLLAGYCNDKMLEIVKWQHSGEPTFQFHAQFLDPDGDNRITKSEYNSTDERVARYRTNALKNTNFEFFDFTKDSVLTKEDFAILVKPRLDAILNACEKGDDEWIWKNYFRVTSAWLKEHDELEPNKERMLRLEMPIYIFQGTLDANTPVAGAIDIEERFKRAGKNNLTVYTFNKYDHDLNFAQWIMRDTKSDGIEKIIEVAELLKN